VFPVRWKMVGRGKASSLSGRVFTFDISRPAKRFPELRRRILRKEQGLGHAIGLRPIDWREKLRI
jgi:hypothetical protein